MPLLYQSHNAHGQLGGIYFCLPLALYFIKTWDCILKVLCIEFVSQFLFASAKGALASWNLKKVYLQPSLGEPVPLCWAACSLFRLPASREPSPRLGSWCPASHTNGHAVEIRGILCLIPNLPCKSGDYISIFQEPYVAQNTTLATSKQCRMVLCWDILP